MSLKLYYETLFELAIKHHYHLDDGDSIFDTLSAARQLALQLRYNVGDFLSIQPSAATHSLLAGCHAVFKTTPGGFITGIRYSSETGIKLPDVSLEDDSVFSFYLNVVDGLFANYTMLPLQPAPDRIFYFTNNAAYAQRVAPFITATPQVYQGGTTYYPGDMLVDNHTAPTKLYIARKKNSSNPSGGPVGNWDTDPLVSGKPLLYASAADSIRCSGNIFIYTPTVANKMPLLSITDRKGNALPVISNIETGDFNTIKADISALPHGLYYAHITTADASYTDDFAFYYTTNTTAWGIIDVVVKTSNASYNLLKTDGSLKSPVFNLHFKNRATFWRYVGAAFGPASVTGDTLPLTRQGFIQVKVKDKNNNLTADDLPNATAAMIKPETNQIYSEIFI